MKRFLKIVAAVGLVGALLAGGYLAYLQVNYYRIADHQKLAITNPQRAQLAVDHPYTATTYNIGFGAYNERYSFFMDTGTAKQGHHTRGKYGKATSRAAVQRSTTFVIKQIKAQHPDFALFQEIDTNSTRSYHVNQVRRVAAAFPHLGRVFASNFHSAYLLVPLTDPHGTVRSGLLTLSRYQVQSAQRRQYPVSTHLIEKFVDLDRCFVVLTLPVQNGRHLIMINSHMSAYDRGGKMRAAQLKLLTGVMKQARARGDYVIVGGDFNHALGKQIMTHFRTNQRVPNWVSKMSNQDLPAGFRIVRADNYWTTPTVRATDTAYVPGKTYTTVVDGFIVSDNVTATAHNLATHFQETDHNPVKLTFKLQAE